jgi:hypothetical protein
LVFISLINLQSKDTTKTSYFQAFYVKFALNLSGVQFIGQFL